MQLEGTKNKRAIEKIKLHASEMIKTNVKDLVIVHIGVKTSDGISRFVSRPILRMSVSKTTGLGH